MSAIKSKEDHFMLTKVIKKIKSSMEFHPSVLALKMECSHVKECQGIWQADCSSEQPEAHSQ